MNKNEKYVGKNFDEVKEQLENKGMRTKKTIFSKKIKVGKTEEKDNVYLECEVKKTNLSTEVIFNKDGKILRVGNTKETINHKHISKYYYLSICASSKYFGGQAIDEIKKLKQTKELKRIVEIWEKYHLNDMQPNCIHQKAFNCNIDFTEKAEIETKKCPVNYSYGSKWLIKKIPQKIINEIQELFTNFEVEK